MNIINFKSLDSLPIVFKPFADRLFFAIKLKKSLITRSKSYFRATRDGILFLKLDCHLCKIYHSECH